MTAVYQYTALNEKGKEVTGTITAESDVLARKKLRQSNLIPIEVISVSKSITREGKSIKKIDIKINLQELALFTRELAGLLQAGLEVEQSVYSLANQITDKHFNRIIKSVHARILEGYSLATGLNDFPKAFPQVFRSTVKAAEDAGEIAQVLSHLADYLDRQLYIRQKTIQALIYPAILTVVGLSIVIFLLSTVVPTMLLIFSEAEGKLPILTVILMKISHFIRAFGLYILLGLVAAYFLFKRAMKGEAFQDKVHQMILRLPLIGKMVRLIQTERFLRALGILIKANVPILQAFDVATELVTNHPIKHALQKAKAKVREGASLRASLNQTGYFTYSSLQLIHAGESTSNLGEMVTRAADTQQRTVNSVLDTFLVLFEPMLILTMGGIVLFIVLAILLPIFELSNLIR